MVRGALHSCSTYFALGVFVYTGTGSLALVYGRIPCRRQCHKQTHACSGTDMGYPVAAVQNTRSLSHFKLNQQQLLGALLREAPHIRADRRRVVVVEVSRDVGGVARLARCDSSVAQYGTHPGSVPRDNELNTIEWCG